ncbi:hypothetical protein SDC9_107185 [bioreactor metagenome]|uniref:Uncharacterized protein n=1 Tax=bioreactor metagenome TaxID=1076179 RepID=A0A645BF47_9ZZZZ
MVLLNNLQYFPGQSILPAQDQAVTDMGGDDGGGYSRIGLVMQIAHPDLVFLKIVRTLKFTDVVVIPAKPG